MKLTEAMKAWLIENCDVKKDATDDEFRAAVGVALAEGKLTPVKLAELSQTKETQEANAFATQLDGLGKSLATLTELLADRKATEKEETPPETESKDKETETKETETKETKPKTKGMKPLTDLHKLLSSVDPERDDDIDVRVKEAAEMYDSSTKSLTYPALMKEAGGDSRPHPFGGQPVREFGLSGRALNEPSERDKAVVGAYAKFLVSKARNRSSTLAFHSLPSHDKELLLYAMDKMSWGGDSAGRDDYNDIDNRKLTPTEQKAVIDDSTSGGLEAAPIVFDDMVIQTPLLYGELFPLVNVVNLDRGRRVEGVSTGTVTGSWGGVDASAITLFTTTSYVAAFDTTIYRWQGAIQIGLDFLSDTPIDFAAHITAQYGERLLEDLDDVISAGNGTTQPEGVMNCGATAVAFGGSTTIGGYESLRFGVAKAEHKANVRNTAVFCGNETSYSRARALSVGGSDARRLFGMDHFNTQAGGYTIGGGAYKINEALANTQIFYVILARYRMYRRRGLTIRSSTEGDTLIRNNEMLLVAMARFGGQMERSAAASLTTTAPS